MLGPMPKPEKTSGPGTLCPEFEYGEPMVDDEAEGPDAVDRFEGGARSSGESYGDRCGDCLSKKCCEGSG
jgi:hypothetical protein